MNAKTILRGSCSLAALAVTALSMSSVGALAQVTNPVDPTYVGTSGAAPLYILNNGVPAPFAPSQNAPVSTTGAGAAVAGSTTTTATPGQDQFTSTGGGTPTVTTTTATTPAYYTLDANTNTVTFHPAVTTPPSFTSKLSQSWQNTTVNQNGVVVQGNSIETSGASNASGVFAPGATTTYDATFIGLNGVDGKVTASGGLARPSHPT